MSQFDIAAGISEKALNQLVSDLYKKPVAKQKIFSCSGTEAIEDIGEIAYSIVVNEAPTFDLVMPGDNDWNKAVNPGGKPKPVADGLQLILGSATGSVSIDKDEPVTATGKISLFGKLNTGDPINPYMEVEAVLLDESSFSELDKELVNQVLIPKALEMANKLLKSITIPAIPEVAGLNFQAIRVAITNKCIVAATSLERPEPTDITDFWPPQGAEVFVQTNDVVANVLLAREVAGKTHSCDGKTGSSEAYAAYKASVKILAAWLKMIGDKMIFTIAMTDMAATVEAGGVGVTVAKTVLCPIGTALDAIADPDNWDKIIGSAAVAIIPDNITAPVEVSISKVENAEKKIVQMAFLKIVEVTDFKVFASPTWSKSITGSALMTATAMLATLLPEKIQMMIIDKIIKDGLQNVPLFVMPDISKTIEGITISLESVNRPLRVYGNTLVGEITAKIS
jgi:hypothetical protein